MDITLLRDVYNPTYTEGRFIIPDIGTTIYTIEQPWADNRVGHSCVPDGQYRLSRYYSPAHKQWTFRLVAPMLGVYADRLQAMDTIRALVRDEVEIHAANWARQLQACIAPGLTRGQYLDPEAGQVVEGVGRSEAALAVVFSVLHPEVDTGNPYPHTLTIKPSINVKSPCQGYVFPPTS